MSEATEFISLFLGGVDLSGFVTMDELTRIEAGEVIEVVIRHVQATHQDVGETLPLGDLRCTFAGGEPIA